MNTIRSTWYGWATLCVAGGGAYYFAKQQINADRAARYDSERQRQQRLHRLEHPQVSGTSNTSSSRSNIGDKSASYTDEHNSSHSRQGLDIAGNPSAEASEDPAAVGHAPEPAGNKPRERSQYEGNPYRSRKGDRFS